MTKEVHPHSKHRERMRERFLKNGFEGYAPHEVLRDVTPTSLRTGL